MATEDRTSTTTQALADPGLRRALEEFVRRRVRDTEVDDVVQTVLCDALAAPGRPGEPEELRRWLFGIARHKVADLHRRSSREVAAELPDLAVEPPPVEERELARWAERQAASSHEAKQTLAWMAREGEGEKLESIAAEEQVPAARVRQRVSRMRRWMKERWLAELAAVAALAILAIVLARLLRRSPELPELAPRPEPAPSAPLLDPPLPLDREREARPLRAEALRACDKAEWQRCLEGLDQAAKLDAAGDSAPEVVEARARARRALDGNQRDLTVPDTSPTGRIPAPKRLPNTITPGPRSKVAPVPSTMKPSKPPPSGKGSDLQLKSSGMSK